MIKQVAKSAAVVAMSLIMAAVASVAWSLSISSEVTVAPTSHLEYNGRTLNIDAQLCSFRGPGLTWILGSYDTAGHTAPYTSSDYNQINGHVFASGDENHPFYDPSTSTSKVSFVANQDLFNHTISDDGVFWITGVYQNGDGILAIIHAEGVSGTDPYPGVGVVSKTRIGLAWLANGSSTFDFLGHMVIMNGDPSTNGKNIQGAPYLIKNGYLYLYYHDYHGISCARANLATILDYADQGAYLEWDHTDYQGNLDAVSWFQKYYWKNTGGVYTKDWGNALDPNLIGVTQLASGGSTLMGCSHGDIIHSSTTGKYYMVTSGLGNHPYDVYGYYEDESFIRIYQSTDGLNWSFADDITCAATDGSQEGYQYVSLMSTSGYDNGECGSSFYIYSGKDIDIDANNDQTDRHFVRFRVDL